MNSTDPYIFATERAERDGIPLRDANIPPVTSRLSRYGWLQGTSGTSDDHASPEEHGTTTSRRLLTFVRSPWFTERRERGALLTVEAPLVGKSADKTLEVDARGRLMVARFCASEKVTDCLKSPLPHTCDVFCMKARLVHSENQWRG